MHLGRIVGRIGKRWCARGVEGMGGLMKLIGGVGRMGQLRMYLFVCVNVCVNVCASGSAS
jgi:hypothetical protein